jgi:hypothetical protein
MASRQVGVDCRDLSSSSPCCKCCSFVKIGIGVAYMCRVEKISTAMVLGGLLDRYMLLYEHQEDVCYVSPSHNYGTVTQQCLQVLWSMGLLRGGKNEAVRGL